MLAAALVIGVLLRPDPLLPARAVAAEEAPALDPGVSRPLRRGAGSPAPSATGRCSAAAIAGLAAAHAAMVR